MNARRLILALIGLGIVAVALVVFGRFFFAPPPPPPPAAGPTVEANATILRCNGDFDVQYQVTNNLTFANRYDLTSPGNVNIQPDPTVEPAMLTLTTTDFGKSGFANVTGKVLSLCDAATVNLQATGQSGPSIGTGAANLGPLVVLSRAPETAIGNPDFSYTVELSCCPGAPAGPYILDFASPSTQGVENQKVTPTRVTCGAGGPGKVIVTGTRRKDAEQAVVTLSVRRVGGATCFVRTLIRN